MTLNGFSAACSKRFKKMPSDVRSPARWDREASDAGLVETPPSSSQSNQQPQQNFTVDRTPETQNSLSRIVSGIDQADARERYNVEEADSKIPSSPNSSASSVNLPRKIISWKDGDPENPYNWSSVCSRFLVVL
jgi:hypothetical protein